MTASTVTHEQPEDTPSERRAKSREGKVLIGGFFDKAIRVEMKMISAREGRTQQELIDEALQLLFRRARRSAAARSVR